MKLLSAFLVFVKISLSLGELLDTSSVTNLAILARNVGGVFETVENDARTYLGKLQATVAALANNVFSLNASTPWLMSTDYPGIVSNVSSNITGLMENVTSTFLSFQNIIRDYQEYANGLDVISSDLFNSVRISTNSTVNSSKCQRLLSTMNSLVVGSYSNQLRSCRASYSTKYNGFQAALDRSVTNIRVNTGLIVYRILGCRVINFINKGNFVTCANNAINSFDFTSAYNEVSGITSSYQSSIQNAHQSCINSIPSNITVPLAKSASDLKNCVNP